MFLLCSCFRELAIKYYLKIVCLFTGLGFRFLCCFLEKAQCCNKRSPRSTEPGVTLSLGTKTVTEVKPAVTEAALLLVLEKLFEVVLNLPWINR